jgi:hypothetical protein
LPTTVGPSLEAELAAEADGRATATLAEARVDRAMKWRRFRRECTRPECLAGPRIQVDKFGRHQARPANRASAPDSVIDFPTWPHDDHPP